MKNLLLALAVLAPKGASAAPMPAEEAFSAALQGAAFDTKAARAITQKPAAIVSFETSLESMGAPAVSIPLSPILNNIRRTAASFSADGTNVHVFGDKSQNKNEWFIGIAAENASAQFYKGKKILKWWPVYRGEAKFTLNGRNYKVWIDGALTDRMGSTVNIRSDDKTIAAKWQIRELSKAAYEAGTPVTVGGRSFRLLYSENFNEDGNGAFSGLSGDRSIVLMSHAGGDKYTGFHWYEREIPRDTVLVATPREAKADDSYGAGAFSLGLRINNGSLELYSR